MDLSRTSTPSRAPRVAKATLCNEASLALQARDVLATACRDQFDSAPSSTARHHELFPGSARRRPVPAGCRWDGVPSSFVHAMTSPQFGLLPARGHDRCPVLPAAQPVARDRLEFDPGRRTEIGEDLALEPSTPAFRGLEARRAERPQRHPCGSFGAVEVFADDAASVPRGP